MIKIKSACRSILRAWNVSLLAGVLLGGVALIPATSARAQAPGLPPHEAQPLETVLVPGTVPVDEELEDAVSAALTMGRDLFPELQHFAITDVRQIDDWALASVIGLAQVHDGLVWGIDDGAWFGLVLLQREAPGKWLGAVQGTPEFSALLDGVPDSFIEEEARRDLDPGQRVPMAGGTYIFPWQAGTAMYYGSLGVHNNGFSFGDHVGWKAVDMLSDGNTAAGHAPNRLLAAAAGTISYKCTDSSNVAILLGDFFYTHLENNAGLQTGIAFAQGAELGQMKVGSFGAQGAGCGWAQQSAGWFHVHWGFPDADLQIEDWTLSMSTQNWTNGTATVTPGGGWITAKGQSGLQISGNAGAPGVVLRYEDGASKTVTADAGGEYAFMVPGGWSGEVTPALPGYRFDPVSRLHADVTAEQAGQDYTAIVVARARPADGEVVCTRPGIGVDLTLTDLARKPDGTFDPSTVMLRLNDVDVTYLARLRVAMAHPAVSAQIVFTPEGDLPQGPHTASFTYPTETGPTTMNWDFTVQDAACAGALAQQAVGEVSSPSLESQRSTTGAAASTDIAPTPPIEAEPVQAERTRRPQFTPGPTGGVSNETTPASQAQPAPFDAPVPVISGGPLGCLPWGLTCPRTITLKD